MLYAENILPASADQSPPWLNILADASKSGLVADNAAQNLEAHFAIGLIQGPALFNAIADLIRQGGAAEKAVAELDRLFFPDDVIELRAICPDSRSISCLSHRLGDPEERAALIAFVRTHIGRRNLYVGVNPRLPERAGQVRAGNAEDVARRRHVVLDLDRHAAPPADPGWRSTVAAIRERMSPRLVLDTGNGVHLWLPVSAVDTPEAVSASAATLSAALERIGSDNMADPARIVRLPWTINLPNETKRKRGAVPCWALPVREDRA